jgi:hypothetical protein
MADQNSLPVDSAAQAFEQLRREVSLLRRGIEALTAERQELPDYTETLQDLDRRLEDVRRWARAISERPALQLTPTAVAEQIEGAASHARETQSNQAAKACVALRSAADRLDALYVRARSIKEQRRLILLAAASSFLGGTATGILLW